ncbi:hypothetical protein E4U42_000348 [Claviceps africana]|uniref:Reticulon-like protein n=1 Tax=Claviceps africana TaxID=83212 RepID=A0A8K0IZX4_9HYPO|nr:hypothetical protein E4U42_000348 [Claviceps africana]
MADTAPNGESLLDITKDNAAAAYDSVTNGPVAQTVKEEQLKTQNEFSNLAASRRTPVNPAATGQPLTHYHSFFSELLSWKNPRASAIAYASIVSFIFVARYLDLIRWALKLSSVVLSVTVAAEIAGKAVLNHGLTTQMRPRRYITVSRATLDKFIGDVHELINFFVIEAQRILFVENIGASAAACFTAFVSYHLVKLVPYWGLAILATTVAFFVPLVYTTNQELIDQQLKNASEAICAQTAQVRSVAQKQADHIAAMSKQYAGNYTGKVQEMLRGRGAASSSPASSPQQPASTVSTAHPTSAAPIKQPEFPVAPTEEPELKKVAEPQDPIPTEPDNLEAEPLIAS